MASEVPLFTSPLRRRLDGGVRNLPRLGSHPARFPEEAESSEVDVRLARESHLPCARRRLGQQATRHEAQPLLPLRQRYVSRREIRQAPRFAHHGASHALGGNRALGTAIRVASIRRRRGACQVPRCAPCSRRFAWCLLLWHGLDADKRHRSDLFP